MPCGKGCNHKDIKTQYIGDVQIDMLSELPEYLLAERDVEDELSGDTVRSLVRIPTNRLLEALGVSNTFEVLAGNDGNGDPITIPEGQVRDGVLYVDSEGKLRATYGYSEVLPNAQFIMLGMDGDKVICQGSGIATVPGGHEYTVGAQYWHQDAGPSSEGPVGHSPFSLFVPISETQILINMGQWYIPGA